VSNAERLIEVLEPIFPEEEIEVDGALIEGLVAGAGDLAADDLVVVMNGGGGFEATFEGLDGLVEAWGDWLATFSRVRFEIEDVQEIGQNVLTLVRQMGVTRHGEVEISQPSAAVWKFRDGRLVRIEFHLDRELALKSAGRPA
jgi:ketosteroid isomerase-like protein